MISNHAQTQQQANGSKNKILFSSNLKKGQVFQGKNRKIKVDIWQIGHTLNPSWKIEQVVGQNWGKSKPSYLQFIALKSGN